MKADGEAAARAEDAFGLDCAAVGLDEPAGDGQTQSGSAGAAGAGRVNSVEPVEQARQIFGRYARAGVSHGHLDAAAVGVG